MKHQVWKDTWRRIDGILCGVPLDDEDAERADKIIALLQGMPIYRARDLLKSICDSFDRILL